MKKLMVVVGTRPNFIKVTRFKAVAAERGMEVQLVHTGQHYDEKMSTVFFDQFGLLPDHFLNTPQASPAAQMGHIMIALEAAAQVLVDRVRGVVVASQYVLLEYDITETHVQAAAEITPGLEAPTISPLSKPGYVAIRALVPRNGVNDVMDQLYELGARGILAIDLRTCRL